MIPNLIKISKQILGSSLSLPAYGRVGKGNTPWRRISQSEIRKIAAAKKEAAKAPVVEHFTFSFARCGECGYCVTALSVIKTKIDRLMDSYLKGSFEGDKSSLAVYS